MIDDIKILQILNNLELMLNTAVVKSIRRHNEKEIYGERRYRLYTANNNVLQIIKDYEDWRYRN